MNFVFLMKSGECNIVPLHLKNHFGCANTVVGTTKEIGITNCAHLMAYKILWLIANGNKLGWYMFWKDILNCFEKVMQIASSDSDKKR